MIIAIRTAKKSEILEISFFCGKSKCKNIDLEDCNKRSEFTWFQCAKKCGTCHLLDDQIRCHSHPNVPSYAQKHPSSSLRLDHNFEKFLDCLF